MASFVSSTPTLKYNSGNQTITSASALTLAHGLGAIPDAIICEAVCLTAEGNWSVGDVTEFNVNSNAPSDRFYVVEKNSTNVIIHFCTNASQLQLVNKTTKVGFAATNANWAIRVRALIYG